MRSGPSFSILALFLLSFFCDIDENAEYITLKLEMSCKFFAITTQPSTKANILIVC